MDFFASQETARRHTKLLLCYFVLAIIGLTISLYGVLMATEHFLARHDRGAPLPWWNTQHFLWSSGVTLTIVLLGSCYKHMQLSGGGRVVAHDLGGRLVSRDTQQTDERRLLNVVEEMALAAGMPVPDVYLLDDEDGINAFAAGHTPGDAVIGVTRGSLRKLSRDELQGVMAHEFSHILNGDMRLNLRLIGWVHGILVIALLGQILLRLAAEASGGRSEKDGGWRLGAIVVGAAIMAIGYLGVLFANLIKAAISRQREFLADASAVQFTRNPDGIAGALRKIGGTTSKSYLQTAGAEIASHMLFGAGRASRLFESHPPLQERIQRIQPSWDGKYHSGQGADEKIRYPSEQPPAVPTSARQNFATAALTAAQAAQTQPQNLGGSLSPETLDRARTLQAAFPEHWHALLRDPTSAQAMMFALILSHDPGLLEEEQRTLQTNVEPDVMDLTLRLHQEVHDRPSAQLIAVIDLAIPALRRLAAAEYQRFSSTLKDLMASDQKLDLFEFMVQKILHRHLDLWFHKVSPPALRHLSMDQLLPEAQIIIAMLAQTGSATVEEAQRSYAAARASLPALPAALLPADLAALNRALDRFEQAVPLVKRQLLQTCGQAVLADRIIHDQEFELLRAIADTIGCPVPPQLH